MFAHLRRCTLALLLATPAGAGTLFVDVSSSTGANDGSSWADAFQGPDGLQAALAAAAPGDSIWVAQGTYRPSATGDRKQSFLLQSGVEVYGGFDGTETALEQRDVDLHPTILSGDLLGDDAGGGSGAENSFHVLIGSTANATAVLDGFRVSAGNADELNSNHDRGAGIQCVSPQARPTVRRCTFTNNSALMRGGAGYIAGSASPTFEDCVFEGNRALWGGAIDSVIGASATFRRCRFSGNKARGGGGIELSDSGGASRLSDCLFLGNTSWGFSGGGGIRVVDSSPTIVNCTVVNNVAHVVPFAGIHVAGGQPLIANCVVAGNVGSAGSAAAGSQIEPAGLNVTWTLSNVAYGGTGNVQATPSFEDCGPHPFALAAGSAGVDAGSNAAVAAGSTIDLAGAPRFFDVAGAPNTGLGVSPLVDMGAYETGFDCNGNGVSDTCDIALGTSSDVDGDGLPDECACVGGATPTAYCTAKLNSQGCLPSISSSGVASASSGLPFPIRASSVINQTVGILIYGYQAAATPFQGGTLCVGGTVKRTPGQGSGGSATGSDCTGSFSFDFNAYIALGIDPLLAVVGQPVHVQFWSRDVAASFGSSLTDALQFTICM